MFEKMRKKPIYLWILMEVVILLVVSVLSMFNITGRSTDNRGMLEATKEIGIDTSATSTEEHPQENTEEKNQDSTEDEIIEEEEDRLNLNQAVQFSEDVQTQLDSMSLEQKIAQMFITTPEELTGVNQVTVAGNGTREALKKYPVGGLIYTDNNFQDAEQMNRLLLNTKEMGKEITGVKVFRLIEENARKNSFPLADIEAYAEIPSPTEVAKANDKNALQASLDARANNLTRMGFNMLIGPEIEALADNAEDNEITSKDYVETEIASMKAQNVECIMDSFSGSDTSEHVKENLEASIAAGVNCIMVSNESAKNYTGQRKDLCSLVPETTVELREDYQFEGIIMTDDLSDAKVSNHRKIEEAVSDAIISGKEMLYVRKNFKNAYNAVLDLVNEGKISETVINNAVGRILTVKMTEN